MNKLPIMGMIYATDPNGVIGVVKKGKYTQPFHSKKDFAWFKKNTKDTAVIMGRKTFQDIIDYSGKPLPNRLNIILSNFGYDLPKEIQKQDTNNCIVVSSIKEAIAVVINHDYKRIMFIGGQEVFKAVGSIVDEVFITKYDNYAESDRFNINYFLHYRSDLYEAHTETFTDTDSITGEKLTGEFVHLKSRYPFSNY